MDGDMDGVEGSGGRDRHVEPDDISYASDAAATPKEGRGAAFEKALLAVKNAAPPPSTARDNLLNELARRSEELQEQEDVDVDVDEEHDEPLDDFPGKKRVFSRRGCAKRCEATALWAFGVSALWLLLLSPMRSLTRSAAVVAFTSVFAGALVARALVFLLTLFVYAEAIRERFHATHARIVFCWEGMSPLAIDLALLGACVLALNGIIDSVVLREETFPGPVKRRLNQMAKTLMQCALGYLFQATLVRWLLWRWTEDKYADKVAAATQQLAVLDTLAVYVDQKQSPRAKTWMTAKDLRNKIWSEIKAREHPHDKEKKGNFDKARSKLRNTLQLAGFGKIKSTDACRKVEHKLYSMLKKATHAEQCLDRDLLREIAVGSGRGTGIRARSRAFEALFPADGGKLIGKRQLSFAVEKVFEDRAFLVAAIDTFSLVNSSFKRFGELVWFILAVLAFLNLWGVSSSDAFLSSATVILALSFSLSQIASRVVIGLVFVLCSTPYDVGDRCRVNDVGAALGGGLVFVLEIHLMTTTFKTSFNEVVQFPNHELSGKVIMNLTRSPPASLYIELRLSLRTTPDDIAKLSRALSDYVDLNTDDWTDAYLYFSALESSQGAIVLSAFLNTPTVYSDWKTLFGARSKLFIFIHAYIDAANLYFVGVTEAYLDVSAASAYSANKQRHDDDIDMSQPPFARSNNNNNKMSSNSFKTI